MTHAFLITIGVIIIVFTRKIYHHNFALFLNILIFTNFNFYHLLPRVGEFDAYMESLLVVVLFYLFEEFIVKEKKKTLATNPKLFNLHYRKFILFYLLLGCFGFITALNSGQGLGLSIKAVKYFPILLFFFIIQKKGIDLQRFIYYFVWQGTIIAILSTLQYILFDTYHFFFFYENMLHGIKGLEGLRGLRITEGTTIISCATAVAFATWLRTRKKSYLFHSAFLFVTMVLVVKTRSPIMAVIITTAIVTTAYYWKNLRARLRLLITATIITTFTILLLPQLLPHLSQTSIGQATVNDVQNLSPGSRGGSSLGIRVLCFDYYWQMFTNSPLTGRGILNLTWAGNPDQYIQDTRNFHLADIGTFHTLVEFGIAGAIFLLLLFVTIARDLWRYNYYPEIAAFFILCLLLSPQIDWFFRQDAMFLTNIWISFLGLQSCRHISRQKNTIITSSQNHKGYCLSP